MSEPVFRSAVCTDRGNYRSINEDNFSLGHMHLPPDALGGRFMQSTAPSSSVVCGVFDGIGGEMYGEVASRISAQTLPGYENDILKRGITGIRSFVSGANRDICKLIARSGSTMGTTAVVLSASASGVTAYNIGDSRAYLWREGKLTLLSRDHTVTEAMIAWGELTPEQARLDPRRHQLSQCIGIPPDELELSPFKSITFLPKAGDRYLLCSDGISDVLPDHILSRLLSLGNDPSSMAESIIQAALDYGSKDNCTALVVQAEPWDPTGSGTDRDLCEEPRRNGAKVLFLLLTLLSGFLIGLIACLLLHILT